jgi:hypothetical protein
MSRPPASSILPSGLAAEIALACHPDTPSRAVRRITARVARAGLLDVSFVIEGDVQRLRVPAPRPPRFAEGLWRHTCCEIFVAGQGQPAYHEFNFAHSGEWAAYAFGAYREGATPLERAPAPQISVQRSEIAIRLDARVQLERSLEGSTLCAGLSAVIEDSDGMLSYWALRHPAGRPDFHHRDAFALEL